MKPIMYSLIVLFLPFFISCSNETIYNKVAGVNYGTSFGMCVGYCKRDVSVDSINTKVNCSSWSAELKPISKVIQTSKSTWDSVRVLLNSKEFLLLPETIGCPDCADGGAEWLELKMANGEMHKVTFEYYHEPEILKNYLGALRTILNKNACK